MSRRIGIGPELLTWEQAGIDPSESALMLGNGASIAVWDQFRYGSLFEIASSPGANCPLSEADLELFGRFGPVNFEAVLFALMTARSVNEALGLSAKPIIDRYENIKSALIDAVSSVHVLWADVLVDLRREIAQYIHQYEFVYTTNYDLLTYWSIMSVDPGVVKAFDFFWRERFDESNVNPGQNRTKLLYLHGALHLYQDQSGNTFKLINNGVMDLLALFKYPEARPTASPLFVSEGRSEEKLAAIRRSDYLSFAFKKFESNNLRLVVLGHSLGDSDKHLVSAIRSGSEVPIAIGIFVSDGDTDDDIIRKKVPYVNNFLGRDLVFFDSKTHPLGSPRVRVNPS